MEEELTAGQPALIGERQARTTAMASHFWDSFSDVPWAWATTMQGLTPDQYRAHARQLRLLVETMQRRSWSSRRA